MSMTVKNDGFLYKKDHWGEEADIGDVIVYSKGSLLYTGYILGFTKSGIYVSTVDGIPWKSHLLRNHNSRKYFRYICFKIVDKNTEIPEALKPFCYFHQM